MLTDPRFDRLTRLASRLVRAPVAILPPGGETAAAAAPALGVRACVTVPLVGSDGAVLGSLCAMDCQSREFSREELDALREVAESVVAEMERAAELERRREAERVLRESEARLRDLADHASDLIVVMAPDDGRLLYVNEAWERTFDYQDAEALSMRALDFVAPEFHARCLDASLRIVKGEEVREFEAVLLTKTGRRVVVRGNGSARFEGAMATAVRLIFRDMTAQLQAEMGQSRLVATLGATADFVAIGTVTGSATYINPAGRRMLGIGASEDIGRMPMADVHPAWARERLVREALPAAIRDGIWAGELALLTRDGREIPVSQVIIAHESPRGGRWFVSTVARDISARKQSETETRLLHATSHAIGAAPTLEAGLTAALRLLGAWGGWIYGEAWIPSPDGAVLQCGPIWTADQSRETVARLERFAESSGMFAFRAGEGLPGRVWQSRQPVWVFHQDGGVELPRRAAAHAAGLTAVGAVPVLGHGGEVIAVLVLGADQQRPADEAALRTIGAVGARIGGAIQRKRAEEALRESEARFRRLSDASRDAIAIAEGGTILQVNRAFCELFACGEADAVGVSGLLFCAPEDRALMAQHFRAGAAEGRFEVTALRKNDSTFRAELFMTPILFEGRPADVVVIRDVSERVVVDRSRSELVTIVSHELRTPLTSVRSALSLMEAGVAGDVPPGMLELLHIARANADRSLRLLTDVEDLGRLEAGALTLRGAASLSARALIEAAAENVRAMAEQHRVRLDVRAGDEGPLAGDPERLTQVLVALLSNAVRHSPEQSVVTVTASRASSGSGVRFEVMDHGPGIPPEQIPLLFTRFQPLVPADAGRHDGAGLGLAVARSLVELHGGAMGVDSDPGVRTVFWFEIPNG